MPPIDRNDPPSRRKACLPCTKSRRRCDQARPACLRCSQRNIICRYPTGAIPPAPSSASAPAPAPAPAPSPTPEKLAEKEAQLEAEHDAFPVPFDIPEASCLHMLDSILDSNDDFTGEFFPTSLDCDAAISLPPSTPRLLTTAQDALDRCRHVTVPQVSRMVTSRLQYAMDKIAMAPGQMVLENQTPWCHANLYDDGMPRCMQYAVSSAALHAAKNDANSRVIRDNMESRVQDLLCGPPATTPLETLAYAQALFIYQTLRLLDNDARVRFSYEATMPHLEEAVYALLPYINFDDPPPLSIGEPSAAKSLLPLHPVSVARDFWASWIFQESARRTLSIINLFVLTYRYMRGEAGNQCSKNKAMSRSVTMSAHLWSARDPVEFALAWRNKNHFVVHVDMLDRLTTVLDEAETDDIDEFGKLSLATCLGLDEAKGWLASRGIAL